MHLEKRDLSEVQVGGKPSLAVTQPSYLKVIPHGFLYWQLSTGAFILDHLQGDKYTGQGGKHIYIHVARVMLLCQDSMALHQESCTCLRRQGSLLLGASEKKLL